MGNFNNNGNGTKDEVLQNEFTAYLVLSIRRHRTQYIFRERQRRQNEELLSFQDLTDDKSHVQSSMLNRALFLRVFQDEQFYDSLRLEDMISDQKIYNTYSQLTENAKRILSLKLLLDLTFHEIAEALELSEIYVKIRITAV